MIPLLDSKKKKVLVQPRLKKGRPSQNDGRVLRHQMNASKKRYTKIGKEQYHRFPLVGSLIHDGKIYYLHTYMNGAKNEMENAYT